MANEQSTRDSISLHATRSEKVFNVCNVILMLIIGFVTLYPFWYCVVVSFNEGLDATVAPLFFWPRKWSLENFEFILTNKRTLSGFGVSVARTVIGTITHVLFTGVVAYGLSKRWIMGRKIYMLIFTFTMYFGGGMIPVYLNIQRLGLIDNFLVYIIPGLFSVYDSILIMSYYDSIPGALEEAALIDGAGHLKIFLKIIIPASMPIFATIALFNGVGQWNAYMDTVIYTRSDSLITLQAIMTKMINSAEALQELNEQMAANGAVDGFQTIKPITVRMATMIFTVLPITLVYPFLQKYFVKGIMIGSVKG
ncbi:MAG: carbohydrate ABC transporter permease [Ruminococcaceae bacterium]|nr:carbohydrate ABC transporter permease [Oscillospiraceae bacterium]